MFRDKGYALKIRNVARRFRQLETLEKREVPAISTWWGDLGIGQPARIGATTPGANGLLTVQGGGTGFSTTSDQFHFRYKEMTGDGFISTKLGLVSDIDLSAGGALMFRNSLNANSPFAALTRNPNGGWSYSLRSAPGGMVSTVTYAGPSAQYAKLVRNGPLFSGYVSATGQDGTWVLVGTGSFAANATLDVGLAVTSLSTTSLAGAVFENLTIADPPPIGAGLEGVIDWAYSSAFVDMTKQARQFMTATGFQAVAVDANGWPLADSLVIFQSGLPNQGHIFNGTYKLSFTGQATIDKWVTPGTVTNVQYNATTNTTTADVNLSAPVSDWYLGIVFRNTKRTANSPVGSGITNIKMIRPGFDPANYPTFNPQFTDQLKRFTTLRFMDWTETNNSTVINWADRTPANYARQTLHGVSWEHVVQLANQLGKDIWVNVPAMATNDYATQLATYLKNNLRPDVAVYVEYSNEVWNWGFEQCSWNYNMGVLEVQQGVSPLNFDGDTNAGYWAWRRVGKETKRLSDIFRSVYGDSAMNTRVRVVLAGQSANPETFNQGLKYIRHFHGDPNQYIYGLAGAPYFSLGSLDTNTNLTTTQVIEGLRAAMLNTPAAMQYAQCVASAYANGLKFISYEGGPDTFGPNNIQAKKQAMLDMRMKQIVCDYLVQWFENGGSLFNWFVAGASNWDSQYGTWGLTNDITNPNTPKTQGIDTIMAGSNPLFRAGLSVPGEYSARSTVGSTNTVGNRYAGPGDVLQYMLNSPIDGLFTFKIRYATDLAGRSLRISVNGRSITTLNLPPTATWDTFVDSAAVSLQLTGGQNLLQIEVLGGGLQLGNLKFTTGATRTLLTGTSNTLSAVVTAVNGGSMSGAVQFYDGTTLLGTGSLDAAGRATFSLGNIPAGNHVYTAVYVGNAMYTTSTSPGLSQAADPQPPAQPGPTVLALAIGNGTSQRSMIKTLYVAFDRVVNILAGAFELQLVNGVAPTVNVSTSTVNGRTLATLTFSGTGIVAGSLADGLYTLRVVAARIVDAANPNLIMTSDRVDSFHRLFGDYDGDRDVDATDYFAFRSAFGSSNSTNSPFDSDGDGDVDLSDFREFVARFGRTI